jgi:tRNA modification GTPase
VEDLDLLGVSERQSQLLSSCTEHLQHFKNEAMQGDECDIVVAAEHLRAAAACLARITGRGEAGDVEEVLGVVFEKYFPPHWSFKFQTMLIKHRFCVGK